jgi:hypothetical protein
MLKSISPLIIFDDTNIVWLWYQFVTSIMEYTSFTCDKVRNDDRKKGNFYGTIVFQGYLLT